MKIEIETPSYNPRRYGKPWAATVTFKDCAGEFQWGNWIGAPGEEGILQIECNPGDIVARGQKDNRGPSSNSAPTFYEVTESGELQRIPSRAAAFKLWRARYTPTSPAVTGGAK